jgi:hypothetical protein
MKKISFLLLMVFIATVGLAQTWNTSGNNLSSGSKFGSLNMQPIQIFTGGQFVATFTEYGKFGFGIETPQNMFHIHYPWCEYREGYNVKSSTTDSSTNDTKLGEHDISMVSYDRSVIEFKDLCNWYYKSQCDVPLAGEFWGYDI